MIEHKQWVGLGSKESRVLVRYLGGGPVDPAFAVGVDVEQHQTFHQIGEDQLESNELRHQSCSFTASCRTF